MKLIALAPAVERSAVSVSFSKRWNTYSALVCTLWWNTIECKYV